MTITVDVPGLAHMAALLPHQCPQVAPGMLVLAALADTHDPDGIACKQTCALAVLGVRDALNQPAQLRAAAHDVRAAGREVAGDAATECVGFVFTSNRLEADLAAAGAPWLRWVQVGEGYCTDLRDNTTGPLPSVATAAECLLIRHA